MQSNLVSVIMPIYKETADILNQSILSILKQTYKEIELILIVDYPGKYIDEEFISKNNKSNYNIVIIRNNINLGITKSLNKGIKVSSGKWICRMDADDISHNDRIEKQINYIIEHKVDLVGSNINCFYELKNINTTNYPLSNVKIGRALKYKNCVTHPTWLFDKRIITKIGEYREFVGCEDYDFLIRVKLNGFKINNIFEPLLDYRLSPGGISLSNSAIQEYSARYLRKEYKKNKIPNLDEYFALINLKSTSKKIVRLEKYYSLKNKRTISKYKIFLYLRMLLKPYNFFIDFKNSIMFKIMS